jgi:hypothetical protein
MAVMDPMMTPKAIIGFVRINPIARVVAESATIVSVSVIVTNTLEPNRRVDIATGTSAVAKPRNSKNFAIFLKLHILVLFTGLKTLVYGGSTTHMIAYL